MRSGACAVQQTLTAEAASVLKHSLSLARRRGHAQVTPLHVAATLLSSRTSLLRRACLKSQPHHQTTTTSHHHHHPLQCRALELCFNVALNRLPTTPGPLLHGQPSLSNALIAALKRAQAHQRRGCIEQQQQQPLLTVKVELEQLIISILDDPSVSRVMREAGFSSTAVKNNIEDSSASSVFQCYSSSGVGGVFSSPCSPSATDNQNQRENILNPGNFWHTHFLSYSYDQNPLLFSPPQKKVFPIITTANCESSAAASSVKEDIKLVFEVFLRKNNNNNKRRNTVIIGDSLSITESLVSELMGRLEKGDVPEELKQTHFIKFLFAPVSLRFMKREEVENSILELKKKVDYSIVSGGGAIIYAGDLKWTVVDEKEGDHQVCGGGNYSASDHLVTEIARLVSDNNQNGSSSSKPKVWLMATANYNTYMRCQMRRPPLEIQWGLQAVSVPSGGLGLSLHASSLHDSRIMLSQSPPQSLETKPFANKDEQADHQLLTCCAECTSHFEKEAQLFKSGRQKLPAWLQPQGTEARQKDELVELRRKWSRLCHSLHESRHSQNDLSSALYNNQGLIGKSCSYTGSSYPWWPTNNSIFPDSNSISFADSPPKPAALQSSNPIPRFRRQQSCTIEFNFGNGIQKHHHHHHQVVEPSLDSLKSRDDHDHDHQGKEVKITLALGNSVFSDDSKKWVLEKKSESTTQRTEMCKLLKENVPWQSETIPSIVEAIIDSNSEKQETWLLVQGNDCIGKRRLAHAISESFLGSADLLLHLNMNNNKKRTGTTSINQSEMMLSRALKTHRKLVVLVEDIDLADTRFMKFLADGFETGKFGEIERKQSDIGQAIFILTKGETMSHKVHDLVHKNSVIQMTFKVDEETNSTGFGSTNFDHHKRKAEWELCKNVTAKNPRNNDKENAGSKKDFSRQSSFSSATLDLNMKADEEEEDEDEESEDKPGELSPISSDLTRETNNDVQNPNGFLDSIDNLFVFKRSPAREREMAELFSAMMEGCWFGEERGREQNGVRFSVEERVIERVCIGSGFFTNSLFEKWLKDVFQTSLRNIGKFGGKGGKGMVVRLCLDDKKDDEGILEDGFMGSCLPKSIQVSFKD